MLQAFLLVSNKNACGVDSFILSTYGENNTVITSVRTVMDYNVVIYGFLTLLEIFSQLFYKHSFIQLVFLFYHLLLVILKPSNEYPEITILNKSFFYSFYIVFLYD